MNPLLRNVLAVVAGLVVASVVNGSLIASSGYVAAPPPGADMTSIEGMRAAMPRMTPLHFLMPFLAHALGTLAGALVAAVVAATRKMTFALAIGVIFLVSGITMVAMVGGPLWFIAADLLIAYIPMAWLGGRLGTSAIGRHELAPAAS